MATPSKKAALDSEQRAWNKLADHLRDCEQKGVPLWSRSCDDCRRLYAAHHRACGVLHAYGPESVGPLFDLSGMFNVGAPR